MLGLLAHSDMKVTPGVGAGILCMLKVFQFCVFLEGQPFCLPLVLKAHRALPCNLLFLSLADLFLLLWASLWARYFGCEREDGQQGSGEGHACLNVRAHERAACTVVHGGMLQGHAQSLAACGHAVAMRRRAHEPIVPSLVLLPCRAVACMRQSMLLFRCDFTELAIPTPR